ncbi:MAG: response regulator [Spirochaetota bacterium]
MESKRILIVEDEALIALALQAQLEELGFTIVGIAATGEGAVEAAAAKEPDVILMDILLAGTMTGVEAARTIRSQSPASVVFTTGYSDPDIRAQALAQEPLGYVTKPVTIEKLRPIFESLPPLPTPPR